MDSAVEPSARATSNDVSPNIVAGAHATEEGRIAGQDPEFVPAARFDAQRRVSQAGAPAKLTVLRVIVPAQPHTPRKTTMRCWSNRCLPTQHTSDLHSWQT